MNNIIEVTNLSHQYGTHTALNNLSFYAAEREVVGLLGPNGAGKTTTIRLLNGIFHPTQGEMKVLGLDPVKNGNRIRQQTGVLTETPALYERLSARNNLNFFGTLSGMDRSAIAARSEELLEVFGLSERGDDRVQTFSKGMKQRLALARALLNYPKILFLDEPTAGLDPEAAKQVHDLILAARQKNGQTTLLCTHHLEEAQQLCDRFVIIRQGRLLGSGSLRELQDQFTPGIRLQIDFLEAVSENIRQEFLNISDIKEVKFLSDSSWQLQVADHSIIPAITTYLVELGAKITAVVPHKATLEEIYLKLQNLSQSGAV